MHDRYLWDRSGEPDPEIARLERTLAVLRHRSVPPGVSFPPVAPEASEWPRVRWYSERMAAIAAVLILAVASLLIGLRSRGAGWQVAALDGRPTIGRTAVADRATLG